MTRTNKKEEPTMTTDYESEAAKRLRKARDEYSSFSFETAAIEALCRVLEEMAEKDAKAESFKREVSDAVEEAFVVGVHFEVEELLSRFILPKPVDQLVDVFHDVGMPDYEQHEFREALAKRGYEIVKKGDTK